MVLGELESRLLMNLVVKPPVAFFSAHTHSSLSAHSAHNPAPTFNVGTRRILFSVHIVNNVVPPSTPTPSK
jgi:hypothetical protein